MEQRGGEGGGIARGCLVEGSSPNSLKSPLSTAGITNYKELLMNRCTSTFTPTFDIGFLSNFMNPRISSYGAKALQ